MRGLLGAIGVNACSGSSTLRLLTRRGELKVRLLMGYFLMFTLLKSWLPLGEGKSYIYNLYVVFSFRNLGSFEWKTILWLWTVCKLDLLFGVVYLYDSFLRMVPFYCGGISKLVEPRLFLFYLSLMFLLVILRSLRLLGLVFSFVSLCFCASLRFK